MTSRSSPAWLGAEGARAIGAQLTAGQEGLPPLRNYAAAFRTPAVLLLTAQYIFWSIGIYGFILWLPSMLKTGSSLGIVAVG